MTVTKQVKDKLKKEYRLHSKDTGSADVQIALLTERINSITEHLQSFKKDHETRRSLLKLVGKRRRLLDYLSLTDYKRYQDVIARLKLRK